MTDGMSSIFTREKLQGTAIIMLEEFLMKFGRYEALSGSEAEETISLPLRKKNSAKPQGHVDVSIRVFEEKEGVYSHSDAGLGEGFRYADSNSNSFSDRQVTSYPNQSQRPQHSPFENQTHNRPLHPYNHSALNTTNYEEQEAHNRARTPSPPPPPSNTGFLPTLFPDTCINMPGSGAFAAAALIFGDDFLSGSSFPSSVSTDPSF
ncbi:uncharacterized protein A4U43_C08F33190 [Asparagus officinalis]|nr:uncharacterized protein A4U43_C08F33190 [Asparagus officinalis]